MSLPSMPEWLSTNETMFTWRENSRKVTRFRWIVNVSSIMGSVLNTWVSIISHADKLPENKPHTGLYQHWHPEKTGEKDFIQYKQDVSPSRASSAKQRTEWGGKELHTGTETTRHRCSGARYVKTGKGGGGESGSKKWRDRIDACARRRGGRGYIPVKVKVKVL